MSGQGRELLGLSDQEIAGSVAPGLRKIGVRIMHMPDTPGAGAVIEAMLSTSVKNMAPHHPYRVALGELATRLSNMLEGRS